MTDASDSGSSTEADTADLIEQAQPAAAEPIEQSLDREANAPFGGPDEDEALREEAADSTDGGA
jgi:hypothetical protein